MEDIKFSPPSPTLASRRWLVNLLYGYQKEEEASLRGCAWLLQISPNLCSRRLQQRQTSFRHWLLWWYFAASCLSISHRSVLDCCLGVQPPVKLFSEKPLALHTSAVADLSNALAGSSPTIVVGSSSDVVDTVDISLVSGSLPITVAGPSSGEVISGSSPTDKAIHIFYSGP
ncbi:predicted protein [Arabidopsis lyrata subsp. lyrata]|uniref:Predicted protein n=1 Tax=Arabidopsis lyrata subsp. lyrata TaxID=81972 RepID=D7KXW7_ARALL|nr:predicted protein [Arabidopsis lyrata subsp. lyrata]